GPSGWLSGLSVRADGRLLAVSGSGGVVQVWDLGQTPPQRQTWRLFPYGNWVPEVVFSPEGRHLVTGNQDGTLHVYRLGPPGKNGWQGLPGPDPVAQLVWRVPLPGGGIHHVALSRDGKSAFSTAADGQVRVWDVGTGKERTRLPHPAGVIRVVVTPDDR